MRRRSWPAASALSGLRMYWGTTLLLVATVALCLGVLFPVAALAGTAHLLIGTIRGGALGLTWVPDAQAPAETQRRAVDVLFGMLTGVSVATLGSAAITLIALFGARAASRSVELVVRRAVGASRRALRASALLEAGIITATAILVGGALGSGLTRVAVGEWPGTVTYRSAGLPIALAAALVGLLVVGTLLPIVFARRGPLTNAEPESRAIFGPAVLQLAVSLAVVTTSALIARHAAGVAQSGRTHGGTVLQLTTPNARADELSERYTAMLKRSRALSGSGSLTSPGALVGLGTVSTVMTDCGDCSQGGIPSRFQMFYATHQFVSPDSFQALGLRLVGGRALALSDRWGTRRVAVVNRALAERHFERRGAIGRPMTVGVDKRWYTVIGVVDGPPAVGFGSRFQPPFTVYLSILQHPVNAADLLVSSPAGPHALVAVDRELALLRPLGTQVVTTSESHLLAAEAAPVAWFARWIRVQGWATMFVATVGMFVVMRLWVLSLLPELGVRRALGASRRQVLAIVLAQAARIAMVGVAAGLWFGWAVWSTLPSILTGAAAWDTVAIAQVGLVLAVATFSGAVFPALGAARASPAGLMSNSDG